jgi:hypothetical protein
VVVVLIVLFALCIVAMVGLLAEIIDDLLEPGRRAAAFRRELENAVARAICGPLIEVGLTEGAALIRNQLRQIEVARHEAMTAGLAEVYQKHAAELDSLPIDPWEKKIHRERFERDLLNLVARFLRRLPEGE